MGRGFILVVDGKGGQDRWVLRHHDLKALLRAVPKAEQLPFTGLRCMTHRYSTIIIGAGAAGLAAGRVLHDAGSDVLLLEARPRIGGRVWTDVLFADLPIERGAEFIHGEHAATHALVRAAGLTTTEVPRYPALRWWEAGQQWSRAALAAHGRTLLEDLFDAYDALPQHHHDGDQSLADYLRARGFDASALAVADVILAQTLCASLETLSCADIVREMHADHAGAREFRIREGYAPLFQWLACDLDVRLNAPVRFVRQRANGVEVQTDDDTFVARDCIITLPVSLLQAGTIGFDPPLAPAKQDAIRAFRVEPATKLIYRFDTPLWDEELVYLAHSGLIARWWTPGYGRPGSTILTAFVTAERARSVDALDEAAALRCGLDELGTLLGVSTIHRHCVAAQRVAWASDTYARGGYAHLAPGSAAARPILAQPDGALHFAGEATAFDTNPQTVHGAIESGWRAARECLA